MMTKRSSPMVSSGSGIVNESGSSKTVVASANATPCFRWFAESFFRSHSKAIPYHTSPVEFSSLFRSQGGAIGEAKPPAEPEPVKE